MVNETQIFSLLPTGPSGGSGGRPTQALKEGPAFQDSLDDAVGETQTPQKSHAPQETPSSGSEHPVRVENHNSRESLETELNHPIAANPPAEGGPPPPSDLNSEEAGELVNFAGPNGGAEIQNLLQALAETLNQLNALEENRAGGQGLSGEELLSRLRTQEQRLIDLLVNSGVPPAQAKEFLAGAKLAQIEKPNPLEGLSLPKPDFFSQFGLSDLEEGFNLPLALQEKTIQAQGPGTFSAISRFEQGILLSENSSGGSALPSGSVLETLSFKGPDGQKLSLDMPAQFIANQPASSLEGNKPVFPEPVISRGIHEARVIQQIVGKFSLRFQGANSEIKLTLDPPSLGTVRMNIATAGENVKTMIITENHAVKQIIENNLSQLKDSMNGQGLKVDSFTVLVGGNPENPKQNTPQEELAFATHGAGDPPRIGEIHEEPIPQPLSTFSWRPGSISVFA